MLMLRSFFWLVFSLLVMAATAWGGVPLRVQVSVPPQLEWVRAIGAELVVAEAFLDQGQPCGDFNPLPSQMRRLGESALFFRVGAIYEDALMPKLRTSFPAVQVVAAPTGFEDTAGEACCAHHAHDPHLWMNPDFARAQIAIMVRALSEAMPEHADTFAQRAVRYEADLDSVLQQLQQQLAPYAGKRFFVYHPAFSALAHYFDLHQVAIEQHGSEPSPRQMRRLIQQARTSGVSAIFVQPDEPKTSVRQIANAIGAEVVILDALRPDWLANLQEIGSALAHSFAQPVAEGSL